MCHTFKFLNHAEDRAREDCLMASDIAITPGQTLIIRDGITNVYKVFDSYTEYAAAYQGQYLTHEVIFGWQAQKPKFDIDGGNEELFADFVMYLETAFEDAYSIEPEFIVCDSSSADKFSKHVIVGNCAFKNAREADWFTREVLKPMCSDEIVAVVDWNVNKPNQNLRTPGSTKDTRTKRVAKPYRPQEAFVTLGTQALPILPLIAPGEPIRAEEIKADVTSEQLEIVRGSIDSSVFMYHGANKNILTFNRIANSYCDICDRIHDHSGIYVVVFPDAIRRGCYRDQTKPHKLVLLWSAPKVAIPETTGLPPIFDSDCKTVFADYRRIQTTHEAIGKYILETIAYVVANGKSFWVTKDIVNGEVMYELHPAVKKTTFGAISWFVGDQPIVLEKQLLKLRDQISYDRMDFLPGLTVEVSERVFNSFAGYMHKVQPAINFQLCEPILYQFREVWANGNASIYEYLLNFFAHLVQKPQQRMDTALIVRGRQGAGKGILVDFIGKKVLGNRWYAYIDKIGDLFKKFNAQFTNKLLTCVDETRTCEKSRGEISDELKAIITRTQVNIERKGIDVISVSDYNNYIFLTNRDTPLPIEADDRRFFAFDASEKHIGDTEYFAQLAASMTTEAGEAFFQYLVQRDISQWNPRVRPVTSAKIDMKLDNLERPHQMLMQILRGEFISDIWNGRIINGMLSISTQELFTIYPQWCGVQNIPCTLTKDKFTKDINRLRPSTQYTVGGARVRGWQNVSIDDIKASMRSMLREPTLEF